MATLNSHGMEAQEEAIMDLYDEGLPLEEIASRLAVPFARVQKVSWTYGVGRDDLWALRVPSASARLAAAIARVHPEMVSAR